MPSWTDGWPFAAVVVLFAFGALARSQALYWLGRGAAAGALRTRWAQRLDSPRVHRATASIERWGMPVVPLAFLTVGIQSAVFGAAGLLRVGWLRFTLWSLPGVVAWAVLWGGGGTAAVAGAAALAARSPWTLVALAVVTAALAVAALRTRRRREQRGDVEALAEQGRGPQD